MISIPRRVLFQRVEIRHAAHFRSHKLLVTPLSGPDRRFPSKSQMGNHLPLCQRVHPITHLDIQLRRLEPQSWFDISRVVHFVLLLADICTHLSDKDGCVARAYARPTRTPTGSSCVTTLRTIPRAIPSPHA